MGMDVSIVGIAETPPCRASEEDLRTLVLQAVRGALDDAGIEPGEVDGIISDAGIMPNTVPPEYVAAHLGAQRRFSGGSSFGGAGICAAPMLAQGALSGGHASVV